MLDHRRYLSMKSTKAISPLVMSMLPPITTQSAFRPQVAFLRRMHSCEVARARKARALRLATNFSQNADGFENGTYANGEMPGE